MAEKNEGKVVDLTQRVTLYAPATGNQFHAPGQKTTPGALLKDKFLAMGYTETEPKGKKQGGQA